MWINLDRFFTCDPQDNFALCQVGGWFEIHSRILSALNPAEGHRFLRSCIWFLVDRKDLFLTSTAIRLHYPGSGYSVATPAVQPVPVLPLAVGQGGGVWDNSDQSSVEDSLSTPAADTVNLQDGVSDALEDEHVGSIQEQ